MGGDLELSPAVTEFLRSTESHPSALVIEGEAGIGKTTLWLTTSEQARERHFRVLTARAGQAEAGLAYAALADLLAGVLPDELDGLPRLQRVALDRVLLQEDGTGPATDQRVTAAAFLTLIDRLSAAGPVVIAVDDVQWLDASSRTVIAFAARPLKGRIGVLLTERTETESSSGAPWLELTRVDAVKHFRVRPLSLGALRTMIVSRLGRAFPRPTIVRIAELSGGNPFYALELARAMDHSASTTDAALPDSLSDLVSSRLGQLGEETLTVLLAAACLGASTVDVLAKVAGESPERVVDLLEVPEGNGIVQIEGNRVQFTHPLLARGVYTAANPARRRQMHRTLGDFVDQPELRARHLALAASSADETTLHALDAAADTASARGAPAAAAELLELAINLGGGTPERRIQCAEHHFHDGESERADTLLKSTVDLLGPGPLRAKAMNISATIRIYDDSLLEAVDILDVAFGDAAGDRPLMVRSLLLSAFAYSYSGKADDAVRQAQLALQHADAQSMPGPTSQVLAMLVFAKFMRGDGLDEGGLQRALDLEDLDDDAPIQFRASAVKVFTDAWTGRLEAWRDGTVDLKQLYLERGAENDVMSIAAHSALAEVWRGDFAAAAAVADEAMERAEHIGTQHLRGVALTMRATVSAHLGIAADARRDANAALAIAMECNTPQLALRASTVLGFVEISLANYDEAQKALQPLIDAFDVLPGSEIRSRDYAPDAIEALINVGQSAAAEPLIERLEADGKRLDRAWLLATSARCRSMWWAAEGDLDEAMRAVTEAMTQHDRIPMPLERARTQLLLGQLQRRQRFKQAAAETFAKALGEFERMGAALWAERARAELDRPKSAGQEQDSALTRGEQRIAELAVTGMTNRDIATALFISVKTVESNLTQIYRKLGIRSRSQLARTFPPAQP